MGVAAGLERRARPAVAAVAALAAAALAVAAPASAGASQWLAGDLHVHTTHSHDVWGGLGDEGTGLDQAYTLGFNVEGQFLNAAVRGLDFLAITDHDDLRSLTDPGFGAFDVIPIPGYEASFEGHSQMLGARRLYDPGDMRAADIRRVARQLRRGPDRGVFQVNHPAEGSTDFPHDIDWGYGYRVRPDTVEVWNVTTLWQPPMPASSSNDDAIRYWEGWLDRGHRVGATGGSDSHWVATSAVQGVGQPTTWVLAERPTRRGVLEGLRRGRTFISHQPPALGGPRIHLEADASGDGAFDSPVGSRVPADAELRVRVAGAPGALLELVGDGGRRIEGPVAVTGPRFEHRFRAPPASSWVRAEIVAPDLVELRRELCDEHLGGATTYCRNRLMRLAMTSAIYLGR